MTCSSEPKLTLLEELKQNLLSIFEMNYDNQVFEKAVLILKTLYKKRSFLIGSGQSGSHDLSCLIKLLSRFDHQVLFDLSKIFKT